jgi:signal transduction histidine kinase
MANPSTITQSEQSRYATFEAQRRQQLLRLILGVGLVLPGLTTIGGLLAYALGAHDAGTLIDSCVTGLMVLFYALGWWQNQRQHLGSATFLLVSTTGAGIVGTTVVSWLAQGITPISLIQLGFFSVIIILAGALGNLRAILITTVLVNVATLGFLLLAPLAPINRSLAPLGTVQLGTTIMVILAYEWAIAVLMVALWFTYAQSLRAASLAFERAQQLDALKEQFITHINHELRTPVMALMSQVDYLRLGGQRLSPQAQSAALARATTTGEALLHLLENVLSVRRIDAAASPTTAEAIPVESAVQSAIALLPMEDAAQPPRDLLLHIAPKLSVWGDATRLQQILLNLLANALKYSDAGTPIEISAQATSSGQVEIRVRDHGFGIPPEQIPLLFNRFVRLPRDLASTINGSGLGLYLCRVFTESMGGHIAVESSGVAGEGSTFTITLPAHA